jgi:hypothetical protein
MGAICRTLPADMGQGIDDMAANALQPQLEHLEQARRARTYDEGIGLDRMRSGGVVHGLWAVRLQRSS